MARAVEALRARRADVTALGLLVLAPFALAGSLAFDGRVMLLGDDLDQNYPLRVLAGEVIRQGHLPEWDPFLWSGTPLLEGWNAGAMFPATWLFAVLSPVAAWTVGLALTYALAGTGTYLLVRRLGCRPLAAFAGGVAFAYTGFMNGQIVHLGLIEGTALLPFLLIGLDCLARSTGAAPLPGAAPPLHGAAEPEDGAGPAALARRAAPGIVLTAVSAACIVLAGDPRAISTAVVAGVIYAGACLWAAPRRAARLLGLVATSALLGAALSAVQWFGGLAFLHSSQRGSGAFSQFANGSISLGELAQLLLLPYALGGNTWIGLAAYQGPQNTAEVSVAVGLVALVAFVAYLPDALAPAVRTLRRRGRAATTTDGWVTGQVPAAQAWIAFDGGPERRARRRLGAWYLIIAAGALLAAGTTTPLGTLLVKIPLYNGERIQGRNVAALDLALCALLAFLVDDVVSRRAGPLRARWAKALALVPPLAAAGLAIGVSIAPSRVLHSFGMSGPLGLSGLLPRQYVYFAVMLVLTILVVGFVLLASRRAGRRLLAVALVCDLVIAAAGATFATVPSSAVASATSQDATISQLTGGGRYAFYNPFVRTIVDEPIWNLESGLPDDNILRGLPSVQGYGSVVDGTYDQATGTHGVEALNAASLAGDVFDILDLRVLVTLPFYLDQTIPSHDAVPLAGGLLLFGNGVVRPGTLALTTVPEASGPWTIAPGASLDWRLAIPRQIIRVTVFVRSPSGTVPQGIEVGVSSGAPGSKPSMQQVHVAGGEGIDFLPAPQESEAVTVANPGRTPLVVEAVVAVSYHPDQRILLDGGLQGVLAVDHWSYWGRIGPLVLFVNQRAVGPAWLQPLSSQAPQLSRQAPGTVRVDPATATTPERDEVDLPAPALLVRSVTYQPGWTARVTPLGGGPSRTIAPQRLGLVQAIALPRGDFDVTWAYAPMTVRLGWFLTLGGALVVLAWGVVASCRAVRRSRRSPRWRGRGRGLPARRARHRRGLLAPWRLTAGFGP